MEALEIHGEDERSSESIVVTFGSMAVWCRSEMSVLEIGTGEYRGFVLPTSKRMCSSSRACDANLLSCHETVVIG